MSIDMTTVTVDGHEFVVRILPDDDYSPSEYTSEDESPELYYSWRTGEMQYVGVKVTPLVKGEEIEFAAPTLWGVEYGYCAAWNRPIGIAQIIDELVPDLVTDALSLLAQVRKVIG